MTDHPLTVLVVDDEPSVVEVLRSFLESRGVRVTTAAHAAEALALDLSNVQVALVDVYLPGRQDGFALIQELNRRFPDMAKILMSGQAELDDVIAAFAEHAFSFIRKPFSSLKQIAVIVERAAEAKRLEKENREYARRLQASHAMLQERVNSQAAEMQAYQKMLAHLYQVSSRVGRIENADTLLDFVCRAIVETGAFKRAALLVADDRFLIRRAGVWAAEGVSDELRACIRQLEGTPLRPYWFDLWEERIGSAVFLRPPRPEFAAGTTDVRSWERGDGLFVPLFRQDGAVFGFLTLDAPTSGIRPSEDLIHLVEVLLAHSALHLEAQRLRKELESRAEDLELRVAERTAELRLSQEKFSRLVNSTSDIVYITDENEHLTYLNDAFTTTLGYVRENYIGRPLRKLLEELTTDNPINRRALVELAGNNGEHAKHHVELLTRRGDKRILEINRTIIRQGGEFKGTQGIIRDITEHRVLLQQLVTSERLAATGRLAAGVAHEINNPLQAMTTHLSAIENKVRAGEDPTDNLRSVNDALDRVRSIVRSMLDFHRGPLLPHVEVNLNDLIRRVCLLVRKQIDDSGIELHTSLAEELPAVSGAPQELQQVLLNLVLNAIEAMPEGGRLNIETFARESQVECRVSDTGYGIAPEHLQQIFEPFFTFKPSGSGTGLGLYLCRNIVELHQGTIQVTSEKGKGASFTLSFPRA